MFDAQRIQQLAAALEGLPILGVLSTSPAALAGVRFGDVLLAVNGARVRSWADYIAATAAHREGMEVVVFRGGAERRLSLATRRTATPPDHLAIVLDMVANNIAGARLEPETDQPS